jgi:2-haloacid dehalogenase
MSPITRWATFDCYGTLIDWERGIMDAFKGLWPDADAHELLATYHRVEPQVQTGSGSPYAQVLTDALRGVADRHGLTLGDDDRDALSGSLPEWPPFAEVPDALAELQRRGWKIAVLSNTDPELLDASIRRIGVDVDLRITVAEAGSYKPAHGHWDAFFASTDADRAGHVHVAASLFHDIAPCAELGLRAVWINRLDEATDLTVAGELPDVRSLPDVLDGLVAS